MVLGKSDREWLIPITPGFARRLRRFADRSRADARGDRIFVTLRRGRSSGKLDPITKSAVEQMIRATAEKADWLVTTHQVGGMIGLVLSGPEC
jgi:peptidoglycan/xylan/chitin deacetylase (PgdA/CDA1 family)